MAETKRKVDSLFATDRIQKIIINEAVAKIKDKVNDIVAEQTENLSAIDNAAPQMRQGGYNGLNELLAFS